MKTFSNFVETWEREVLTKRGKGDRNAQKQNQAKLQAKYKDIYLVVEYKETEEDDDQGEGEVVVVKEDHVITRVFYSDVLRKWSVHTNEVLLEDGKVVGIAAVPRDEGDDEVEDKRRVIAIGEPLHLCIRRSRLNTGLHMVGSDGRSVA